MRAILIEPISTDVSTIQFCAAQGSRALFYHDLSILFPNVDTVLFESSRFFAINSHFFVPWLANWANNKSRVTVYLLSEPETAYEKATINLLKDTVPVNVIYARQCKQFGCSKVCQLLRPVTVAADGRVSICEKFLSDNSLTFGSLPSPNKFALDAWLDIADVLWNKQLLEIAGQTLTTLGFTDLEPCPYKSYKASLNLVLPTFLVLDQNGGVAQS